MEQQKNKEKNKAGRWIRGLIRGLILLLTGIMVYVGVVLLESPEASQDDSWAVIDDEPITPLQAATMSDAQALARLFGAPLPAFPGVQPYGEARNAAHDGRTARMITLDYNGARIMAVRPASAAPLLLQDGLSVSLRSDITALNLPAVLAEGQGRYCLYFSSDQAAYALIADAGSPEAFLSLARQMTLMP